MTEVIAEIELSNPLELASGETINTLTLSQPKTGDMLKIGQPVEVEFAEGKVRAKADQSKLSEYLPGCTGQPRLIIEQMELSDAIYMLGELETFFTQQAVEMAARMFSARSEEQQAS